MFRKLSIALGTTAVLAITALAPTSASALVWHPHHHWGWGLGGFGAGLATGLIVSNAYAAPAGCYIARRIVETPVGPRLRRVEVCY